MSFIFKDVGALEHLLSPAAVVLMGAACLEYYMFEFHHVICISSHLLLCSGSLARKPSHVKSAPPMFHVLNHRNYPILNTVGSIRRKTSQVGAVLNTSEENVRLVALDC